MAGKPTEDLEWADGVGAQITDPALGYKQTGWVPNTAPPAQYFNWFQNLAYQWQQYLRDFEINLHTWTVLNTFSAGIAVTQSTLNGNGVNSTGNGTGAGGSFTGGGSAPGASFTPGGGGAPVRGAMSSAIQVAPSTPQDGDWWTTATAAFVRIAGVVKQLTSNAAPAILGYGCLNASGQSASTDYYLKAGSKNTQSIDGAESPYNDYIMPFAGRLGVIQFSSFSVAQTVTFKVFKNGALVATAPAWAVPGALAFNSYDASAVTFAAGDRIQIVFNTTGAAVNTVLSADVPAYMS